MRVESDHIIECGKCGKRLYPPVSFLEPGKFRLKPVVPVVMIQKHVVNEHGQDLDPVVLQYLKRGGRCPKCGTVTAQGGQTAVHAVKCGLIPWEMKPVHVIFENRLEGNREVVIDVEKNTVVAETKWPAEALVPPDEQPAKVEEIKPPVTERPSIEAIEAGIPEGEVVQATQVTPAQSEPQPSQQPSAPTSPSPAASNIPPAQPVTPSAQPQSPPSLAQTPNSLAKNPPSMASSGGQPPEVEEEEEESAEEEEEPMEAPELEGIEWRPVTELVRQYGEHYHTKPRPRPRRREMEYEGEFEEVRPKKKQSYLPYVAIGLLAVATVAYFLYRRKHATVQPSSGSSLGMPTGIAPVAPPPVPPTPPPPPQQSAPQNQKPAAPIVADWSQKLKVI